MVGVRERFREWYKENFENVPKSEQANAYFIDTPLDERWPPNDVKAPARTSGGARQETRGGAQQADQVNTTGGTWPFAPGNTNGAEYWNQRYNLPGFW